MLRPPSTIPSSSRPSSALGMYYPKEVSTHFNNYHVVPMHNSTAQEHKQGSTHTTGLILPREGNADDTDMEIAEIINGTVSDASRTKIKREGKRK